MEKVKKLYDDNDNKNNEALYGFLHNNNESIQGSITEQELLPQKIKKLYSNIKNARSRYKKESFISNGSLPRN